MLVTSIFSFFPQCFSTLPGTNLNCFSCVYCVFSKCFQYEQILSISRVKSKGKRGKSSFFLLKNTKPNEAVLLVFSKMCLSHEHACFPLKIEQSVLISFSILKKEKKKNPQRMKTTFPRSVRQILQP